MVLAEEDGVVTDVDGRLIAVDYKTLGKKVYKLLKFERSNQTPASTRSRASAKATSSKGRHPRRWPVDRSR
jgi:DNA-directed RNA polymerase subunit beta